MRTFVYRTLAVAAATATAVTVAPAAMAASADFEDDRSKTDHRVEEIHDGPDGYSERTERYREKDSSTWSDDFYGYHHGHRYRGPSDWRFGDPEHGDFSYRHGRGGHGHHSGNRAGDGGGSR